MGKHNVKIYKKGTGYYGYVLEATGRRFDVQSEAQLDAIYQRLVKWKRTGEIDGMTDEPVQEYKHYIRSVEALEIAREMGFEVPRIHTVNSACVHGSILGARKPGTRWEMPKAEYIKWLRTWAAKRERKRAKELAE